MKGTHADLRNSAGRWGGAAPPRRSSPSSSAASSAGPTSTSPAWPTSADQGGGPPAPPASAWPPASAGCARWPARLPEPVRPASTIPSLEIERSRDRLSRPPAAGCRWCGASRCAVGRGEMVGLVGESGSGKTPDGAGGARPGAAARPGAGRPRAARRPEDGAVDLLTLPARDCGAVRGARIGYRLPGADDGAQPGLHDRLPDRRGGARPPPGDSRRAALRRGGPPARPGGDPRRPPAARRLSRTSSRAASASG